MESEFDNIKEVEFYDYSRNFYPSDENTTSNNSHAVDSKQMRWTPNDNLNNIISDEVNQTTTTTTTTTSATTNNGQQFDDNNLHLSCSDNIDLNQKLSPLGIVVGSGDDNSLHHASTLENNGEEFLATSDVTTEASYDNKNNGKLLTPTTEATSEFDDNNDLELHHHLQHQHQHQHDDEKIILEEKNHQPHSLLHHHEQMLDVDGDYGPEACVDTTDDVVMMTENSADTNNLSEQSTLSHSKDTLPSSDNCGNPFDNKNALDMEDINEHNAGIETHLQSVEDANKATPLLSPEVEDLPLTSDGQMHYTNEGYQQSPLDEMIPAGISNSQKEFEDEFMQSNGHLSPMEVKDDNDEMEKQQQQQIEMESEEVQNMSQQKPELVENFYGNPMESDLVLQEKEILFNNIHNDESDFRLKDEEEILEKHVVETEELVVKESEALDLTQKEQFQPSKHNHEVDILEEKPILTGHYIAYDDSPTQDMEGEEKLNEFADEKQDKEEFSEKEDKVEVNSSMIPSAEIELEEENCIHLEEDVRPSDYLAMLERQKQEEEQLKLQNQQDLDEGSEKDVQYELNEAINNSEEEKQNSMFEESDNKICDELMEKEELEQNIDNNQSTTDDKEYEKAPYEVEELNTLSNIQKEFLETGDPTVISGMFDYNKMESVIKEQVLYAFGLPEKQCFEEPEKVHDNLVSEKNESILAFEQIEKQLEEEPLDKSLPELNNLGEIEGESEENLEDKSHEEEVEKQHEENTEKQVAEEKDHQEIQSVDEPLVDEMEKQMEEDSDNKHLGESSIPADLEDKLQFVQEVLDKHLDEFENEQEHQSLNNDQSLEEVEKQLEEHTEKQTHPEEQPQEQEPVPEPEPEAEPEQKQTNKLPEFEEYEPESYTESDEQEIIEPKDDSCLGDIDKQVQDLAEFVEDLENKHVEELKMDIAAKLLGECTEEQLQKLEEQVIDVNAEPIERAERVEYVFAEPDIDPENMVEVEEPLIVKEQVPIKPSALAEPSAVQPTHESCDESEDEGWKYTKEGQGEKQLGLQGDTVVEEDLLPQEQEAAAKFSIPERKASGNILQQQISINTSNLIESMNDTYEGLTQNITEITDQAVEAVTENKEDQNEQNLNLSQSSTREKLDNIVDDDEEDPNEMNSRLNPEAKEFIPTFSPPLAAKENGFAAIVNTAATAIPPHFKDDVISQSPRKGRESDMDDINIPAENEFDEEIANKPHEWTEEGDVVITEIPSNGRVLFEEMNWKEANHGSEKEEGPLVDSPMTEESPQPASQNFGVCEMSAPVGLENAGMKDSIYIENNTLNDDLNTVQVIPQEFIESGSDSNKEENDAVTKEDVQKILKECEVQPVSHVELIPKVEAALSEEEVPEPIIVENDQKVLQQPAVVVEPEVVAQEPAAAEEVSKEAGLTLGGAVAVVAATAVASVAAATAATTSASKKVEEEKNQKNLKKNTTTTKPKVPDTKKPAVSSTLAAKRTLTDKTKPATAAALAKKTIASTLSAAARPKTAPTTAAAKMAGTEKKTPTSSTTSSMKSRVDGKPATTLANRKPLTSSAAAKTTASKPDDDAKSNTSAAKSSTGGKSTLSSKPSAASSKSSTTNSAKLRSSTASSTVSFNGAAPKTTSATKPTTLAPKTSGTAGGKPSTTSPRGTVASTLRKTEAVKSPTKTTSSTITSRISANGVTKSTTTTRTTTTTKTTPSTGSTTATRTTTSRLSVTGTANPTNKTTTTTNSVAAARKLTPLKKTTTTTTTTNSTTPTARKSIGNKLNSPATKTKDSTAPKPIKKATAVGAQKQQKTENSTPDVPAAAALAEESNKEAIVEEEPKLNGNASPDDVSLLPSTETAAPVAAHPLIEMETA